MTGFVRPPGGRFGTVKSGKKFGPFKAFSVRRDVTGRRSLSLDPGAIVKSLRRRRRDRKAQTTAEE